MCVVFFVFYTVMCTSHGNGKSHARVNSILHTPAMFIATPILALEVLNTPLAFFFSLREERK